jgi:hypothetical protein
MTFSELDLARIDRTVGELCRRRTRPEFRDRLEFIYEITGHNVSIDEVRPYWRQPAEKTRTGVARFKYVGTRREWRLYWMRRDLEWHLYEPDEAISRTLESLVQVVSEDSPCAFFG